MRVHVIMCDVGRQFMRREGRFFGRPDLIDDPNFVPAYKWLVERMVERIGPPPESVPRWPVWAWKRWQSHQRPDLTDRCFRGLKNHVLVSMEIPEDRIVLTDFNTWHHVLNHWYLADPTAEDTGESDVFQQDLAAAGLPLLDRPYPEPFNTRVLQSWNHIFTVDGSTDIQATAWYFDEADVVEEEYFNVPRKAARRGGKAATARPGPGSAAPA